MRYKKILISALAATCMVSVSANANVGTGMQQMFNSMGGFSNTTPPSSYKGQTMNGYSAGGFYARVPVKTYQLASMTPPSLNIGCGGIDFTAGAFSFINKSTLTALFQNIGTSISYAFLLAVKSSMPEMASLFEYLQSVANKVNGMQINACQMAEGVTSVVDDKAALSENVGRAAAHVAGSYSNIFTDAMESMKTTLTSLPDRIRAKNAAVAMDPSSKENVKPGNIVWTALGKSIWLSKPDKEILMSISGTIIVGDNEQPTYIPPLPIDVKSFVGQSSTDVVNFKVYSCGADPECLNPTLVTLNPAPPTFLKSVHAAITRLKTNLQTRGVQAINDFKLVDATITVPVWKIISVSAATNPNMIDDYEPLIAAEIAYEYFRDLQNQAKLSLSSAENSWKSPIAATSLKDIIAHLDQVMAEANTARIAAYNKKIASIEMERELQLLHQTMVNSIPLQAANSMIVFGK